MRSSLLPQIIAVMLARYALTKSSPGGVWGAWPVPGPCYYQHAAAFDPSWFLPVHLRHPFFARRPAAQAVVAGNAADLPARRQHPHPFVGHLPLDRSNGRELFTVAGDRWRGASADISTEWRLQMWRNVLPQIPQYFCWAKVILLMPTISRCLDRQPSRAAPTAGGACGRLPHGPLSVIIPSAFLT